MTARQPALTDCARSWLLLAVALMLFGCASTLLGCASTVPSFAGGETTPSGREDVLLGASSRLLVTSHGVLDAPSRDVVGDGVVPAGAFRVGVDHHADLGVVVAGTSARVEARYGTRLTPSTRMHLGLGAYGAYASDRLGGPIEGYRLGAMIPWIFGYVLGSIAEVWGGVRVGAEFASVDQVNALGLRFGGVVGIALGLRRVHFLAELAADGELWTALAPSSAFVLTPAFGIRVRF